MNRQNVVQILQIICQQHRINPNELRVSKHKVEIYTGRDGESRKKPIGFATIKAPKPKRNRKGLSPQAKILQILRGKS
jgi:predicted Ser/Thr protein kinase